MYQIIKQIITHNIAKPIARAITGFLTQNATLAAQKFAMDKAEQVVDYLPTAMDTLAAVYTQYNEGKIGLNVSTALKAGDMLINGGVLQDMVYLPGRALHEYKYYTHLNNAEFTTRTEDDFVVVTNDKIERRDRDNRLNQHQAAQQTPHQSARLLQMA